jgi:excisionase family DNA binding protein
MDDVSIRKAPRKGPKQESEQLHLRFDIAEAARILRFSRATLYGRISSGAIKAQKDGRRTYITRVELERYVASRGDSLGAGAEPLIKNMTEARPTGAVVSSAGD